MGFPIHEAVIVERHGTAGARCRCRFWCQTIYLNRYHKLNAQGSHAGYARLDYTVARETMWWHLTSLRGADPRPVSKQSSQRPHELRDGFVMNSREGLRQGNANL